MNCRIIINDNKMKSINHLPIHPGELLKEELEVRGISQKVFSEKTGISYTMLNEILNCKRPVTSDLSLLFEAALGINSEMLINMQTRHSLAKSRLEPSMASRISKIRQACASWLL